MNASKREKSLRELLMRADKVQRDFAVLREEFRALRIVTRALHQEYTERWQEFLSNRNCELFELRSGGDGSGQAS
jgi:hypothetical protein